MSKCILLVDDDIDYIDNLARRLKQMLPGYIFELCNNAYFVTNTIKTQLRKWDIIISDVFMPRPINNGSDNTTDINCAIITRNELTCYYWDDSVIKRKPEHNRPQPDHGGFHIAKECLSLLNTNNGSSIPNIKLILISSIQDSRSSLLKFMASAATPDKYLNWLVFLDKGLKIAGTSHDPLFHAALKFLITTNLYECQEQYFKTILWSPIMWRTIGVITEILQKKGLRTLLLLDEGNDKQSKELADIIALQRYEQSRHINNILVINSDKSLSEAENNFPYIVNDIGKITIIFDYNTQIYNNSFLASLEAEPKYKNINTINTDILIIIVGNAASVDKKLLNSKDNVHLLSRMDKADIAAIAEYVVYAQGYGYSITQDAIEWLTSGAWKGTRQELVRILKDVMKKECEITKSNLIDTYSSSSTPTIEGPSSFTFHGEVSKAAIWVEAVDHRIKLEKSGIEISNLTDFLKKVGIESGEIKNRASNFSKALNDNDASAEQKTKIESLKLNSKDFKKTYSIL